MAAKTGTYTLIASNTLGSATNTVTLSSIPATYTDLILVYSGRGSGAGSNAGVGLRFNSDTGSNYSRTYLDGDGSTASSGRNTSMSSIYCGNVPDGGVAAGTFDGGIIHIMDYANTTTYKTQIIRSGPVNLRTDAIVSLWRSTSAINSITFVNLDNNFVAGSTFKLYGIEAGNS